MVKILHDPIYTIAPSFQFFWYVLVYNVKQDFYHQQYDLGSFGGAGALVLTLWASIFSVPGLGAEGEGHSVSYWGLQSTQNHGPCALHFGCEGHYLAYFRGPDRPLISQEGRSDLKEQPIVQKQPTKWRGPQFI